MRRWFRKTVLRRRTTTFVVMGIAFLVFGCGTLNIFVLLKGNLDLLTDYGWQAVMDGGAAQPSRLRLRAT